MPSFGTATNLATVTGGGGLTLINISYCAFWYIQNQSTVDMKVSFPSDTHFGPIILNAAYTAGAGGGYIDSNGFPYFGDISLFSTAPTAQFGSGTSTFAPIQTQTMTGGRGVQNIRG